jgi:uncharacterized protein with von Willebrand factor type A (vWA) domain
MEQRLLRIGRALRRDGAPLSTAEIVDAARAMLAVGVERRGDLREGLRAALVKDPGRNGAFDELFEAEFPAGIEVPARARRRRGRGAAPDGEGSSGGAGGSEAAHGGGAVRTGTAGASPAATAGLDGGEHPGDEARRERREGEEGNEGEAPAGPEPEAGARRDGEEAPGGVPRAHAEVRRSVLAKEFRGRWTGAEEAEALAAAEELAIRLAQRLARRRVRATRGAIDVKATLRANLASGGVPFRLARRTRAPGRRDLVLLADVSGSVRRAAEVFLLILGRLRGRFCGVRAFAYTDRPVEIGRAEAALDPAALAAALARELPLEALSDHGEVFRRFNRDFPRAVGGRSVVVILGDGRSNRLPSQAWELEAIRRRAHRVLWIVPERRPLWGTGDSALADYATHCDAMLAAPTPGALAGALLAVSAAAGQP